MREDSAKSIIAEYRAQRLPSLDGWRAVSVAMVLAAHGSTSSQPDPAVMLTGRMGVWFFFVISGFLITWLLLLEEQQHGRIDYRSFILRRALRILPVYALFLIVGYSIERFCPVRADQMQWLANVTFTANYSETRGITGHLWSLSVEEQFYLLWPSVLVLCGGGHRLAVGVLFAVVVMAPIARGIAYLCGSENTPWFLHTFSFLLQADGLAIGCLAAIIFSRFPRVFVLVSSSPWKVSLFGVLLCALPFLLSGVEGANLIMVPLGQTAQAVGFVLLMSLSIVLPSHLLFRWLNLNFMVWIGVLSYSIYLWHLPFAPKSWGEGAPEGVALVYVPATIGVAIISYYALERPFLILKSRIKRVSTPVLH